MSITVQLLGGLGNQLFSYATGRSLAIDLGTNLKVDVTYLARDKVRRYELDSFNSKISQVITSRNAVLHSTIDLFKRVPRLKARMYSLIGVFLETRTDFHPEVLHLPDGSELKGYFQTPKYFEHNSETIRQEISSVCRPSNWYIQESEALRERGQWIGIHIRLGDYVRLSSMGVASSKYYTQAIQLLWDLGLDLPVVVFSDDVQEAEGLLDHSISKSAYFVEPPTSSRPIESLLLLSQASHLIIGNSSFSWWAAYLGDRRDRRVIAPRPWLNARYHLDRDLIPAPWISLVR